MDPKNKITETDSHYDGLESMSTLDLLQNINREDQKVAIAVQSCIPQIEQLVDLIVDRIKANGRLFYIGAGTSGRLGVVDASEIPPTFGYDHGKVIGIIAGGDQAIRKSVEFAEDHIHQAWKDLSQHHINDQDTLIGIAASGTTPYVLGGIEEANRNGILTAGITNNPGSPLSLIPNISIVINVGPEFVTGSTRMKSGTSQKLVLNMISTAVMIKLGRVKGNKMINMQLSNDKLVDRGIRYVMDAIHVDAPKAAALLKQYGSVHAAVKNWKS